MKKLIALVMVVTLLVSLSGVALASKDVPGNGAPSGPHYNLNLIGKKAEWKLMPLQAGDVEKTWADVSSLKRDYGYNPDTPVETGIKRFIDWYRDYYRV